MPGARSMVEVWSATRAPEASSTQAPAPTTPAYTFSVSGCATAPTIGRPSTQSPIITTNPVSPRMKSLVPSIGSTIQMRERPIRAPVSGISSERIVSLGKAAASRPTMSALAARSASVTGSLPALLSMTSFFP